MGKRSLPSRFMASRRMMPVVVSSQPPMMASMSSGYLVCTRFTRSPPSSMMSVGPTERTSSMQRM